MQLRSSRQDSPSPPNLASAGPLSQGDLVLGRYRVVEQFESGGASVVYRGVDERFSRPVCIKVFQLPEGKDWLYQTSYEHFVQEAYTLSSLTHPNTLRIFDFGHLPPNMEGSAAVTLPAPSKGRGAPVQISEFVPGGTLSSVIRQEGTLQIAQVSRIISSLAGALAEAHQKGLIHRDIKPKNILFCGEGPTREPKLVDFGIAKLNEPDMAMIGSARDTQVVAGRKVLMFSVLWAAPEQIAGQPATAASDVFSLAAVAAFMLFGKPPFAEKTLAEAFEERRNISERLRQLTEEKSMPQGVMRALEEALRLNMTARTQSPVKFAQALADASRPNLHNLATEIKLPARRAMTTRLEGVIEEAGVVLREWMEPCDAAPLVWHEIEQELDLTVAPGCTVRISRLPSGAQIHVRALSHFLCKADGPLSTAQTLVDREKIAVQTRTGELITYLELYTPSESQRVATVPALVVTVPRFIAALSVGRHEEIHLLFAAKHNER